MNVATHLTLEERLKECAERARTLQRMLAELAGEISEISGLVSAEMRDDWKDDVRSMLHLQKSEIVHLLGKQDGEASKPSPTHKYPFRLDPALREVRIGRRRIPLTPNEFKIIECMWEEMPSFVSREFLFSRLYDEHQQKSKRVVDVFISNIRRKLAACEATDVSIQSKSGLGWKLYIAM